MDNTAQRSYVKIRFQLGDSPSVIHSDLKTSQRETPVSLRTVQRWCKALEKGTFKDQKGTSPWTACGDHVSGEHPSCEETAQEEPETECSGGFIRPFPRTNNSLPDHHGPSETPERSFRMGAP